MFTNPLFGGGLGSALLGVNNVPSNQNLQILANAQNVVRLNPNNGVNGGGFQLANSSGNFGTSGETFRFRIITFHSTPTSTNSGEYGLQKGIVSSGGSGGFVTGGGASLDNTASAMLSRETADSGAQFPNINKVFTVTPLSNDDGFGTGDSFRFQGLGDVSGLTPFNFKIEILSRP